MPFGGVFRLLGFTVNVWNKVPWVATKLSATFEEKTPLTITTFMVIDVCPHQFQTLYSWLVCISHGLGKFITDKDII